MIVRSGRQCSGTESVTALICSSWNRTEPDTGYLHLLTCSSVTYTGRNDAHVHLPVDDVAYNISTRHMVSVSRLQYSYIIR